MRSILYGIAILTATTALAVADVPSDAEQRAWADAAWTRVMNVFYCEKTGGIYISSPDRVNKAKDFPGGLLKPEFGYGTGLEDCAIDGGVALSGLVDRFAVTGDEATRRDAAKVARGLLKLTSAHPYRGFVARGLCVEDGKSICRLSSRDQVTHWAHGLYRYYASAMASDAERAEIRLRFSEVADLMLRNVTEKNNWNFLQADGTMDPRGICKMRHTYPHEAARLAMVYALAWKVTGDEKYRKAYEDVREEAVTGSCALATTPDRVVNGLMPDYALIQMNTSLEALLMVEADEAVRARMISAMVMCANIASRRAPVRGSSDTKYLCGCAELHLAQMMVPKAAFDWTAPQQDILARAICAVPADRVGACRACHLFAAYWRARRLRSASPKGTAR